MQEKETKEVVKKKNKAHWYAVNTYSGSEDKVRNAILAKAKNEKIDSLIFEIVVANYKEISTKIKKSTGEEVQVEKIKNSFPGYVFIKMIMSDYAWFVVRNTRGVTGFVGSSGKKAKPFPMTEEEIIAVKKLQDKVEDLSKFKWSIGQNVKIKKGPFAGEAGDIKEINIDNKTVIVNLVLFGKKNPTEVDLNNIKKND